MLDQDGWPRGRYAHWALLVLVIAYMVSFIDRIIISMLVEPIKEDLGFSDTDFAIATGVSFTVFYTLLGLPMGRLADRVSRRGVIGWGIAIWSLFSALTGVVTNFAQMFVCRVGVGVGEAALSPGAYSLIADYFRPSVRGRAIAIYTMGVAIGASMAYFIGGLVISFANSAQFIALPFLGELAPWRFVFIVVGLPGLLVALALLTVREPPRRMENDDPSENEGAEKSGDQFLAFLRQNWRVVTCYVAGYCFIVVPFSAVIHWGPAFLEREFDLTPGEIGLALGIIFIGPGIAGQYLGAALSDRRFGNGVTDAHLRTGRICGILLIPATLLATFSSTIAFSLMAFGAAIFLTCASVGHQAAIGTLIAPNRLRGQISALYILMQALISTLVATLGVALLNDEVFHDPNMIGTSIGILSAASCAAGAILLTFGMKPMRDRMAQIDGGIN